MSSVCHSGAPNDELLSFVLVLIVVITVIMVMVIESRILHSEYETEVDNPINSVIGTSSSPIITDVKVYFSIYVSTIIYTGYSVPVSESVLVRFVRSKTSTHELVTFMTVKVVVNRCDHPRRVFLNET